MTDCRLVETEKELEGLEKEFESDEIIACDLEASELDTKVANIEGIGFGNSNKQFFISFPNGIPLKSVRRFLKKLFDNKQVVFHNAKYDLQLLRKHKLPWPKKIHDTMIMSWLVDENNQHGLKPLAQAILGREAKKWSELNREQDLFRTKEIIAQELADYCGADVKNTYDLFFHFMPIIKQLGLLIDYKKIELPLIIILAKMELRGVKMNINWLNRKRRDIEKVLLELSVNMGKMTGDKDINIHSPKQLEYFLFDILKYAPSKVTDSGKRSTDNKVLEGIVKENDLSDKDFVPMLLKFRELDKIYRTYIISLIDRADDENVIRTHFLQHGTRTGRLASNDPNLQNIPTRSDKWNIRRAFIPREGYKFILADYSQIELRLLAHFSRDEKMIETFNALKDIHKKTMTLTGTKRRVAKAINFGLIYGMGPRTLAHTLGIKEEDAKKYINRFFSGYPKVRDFIRRIQQKALTKGYVETLIGRRRRFHEVKDKRWYNMIKRQAINTKIQGSAADLIKIAMIKVEKALVPFKAFQLIQIHDEIIIEVPIDKVKEVKKVVIQTMENVVKLRVPLKVGVSEGNYWIKD